MKITHSLPCRTRCFASFGMAAMTAWLFCSASATAGISQTVFSIQATNDAGTGAYSANFSDGVWDPGSQTYTWALSSSEVLLDGTSTVATLDGANLTITLTPAPQMTFMFNVLAGGSDTEFQIETALVDFNTIPSAQAAAAFVAGCSVSDSGADDGMWLYEPGMTGSGVFQSYYNTMPAPGALFSDLVSVVGSGSGGTASGSEHQPSSGYASLNADVYDACMRASFVLTDLDRAQGNATYTLVPEPASMALLALVGVLAFARGTRNSDS